MVRVVRASMQLPVMRCWSAHATPLGLVAVDGIPEEALAFIDVGLPRSASDGIQHHAGSSVTETVTMEGGHEGGKSVRLHPSLVARVVGGLACAGDRLEADVWVESNRRP